MRGLQHNVIEIQDTESNNIEKILVFLRPGENKIDVSTTRKEAQDILQKVKVRRKFPPVSRKAKLILMGIGCILLAGMVMALLI